MIQVHQGRIKELARSKRILERGVTHQFLHAMVGAEGFMLAIWHQVSPVAPPDSSSYKNFRL